MINIICPNCKSISDWKHYINNEYTNLVESFNNFIRSLIPIIESISDNLVEPNVVFKCSCGVKHLDSDRFAYQLSKNYVLLWEDNKCFLQSIINLDLSIEEPKLIELSNNTTVDSFKTNY